jgi:hypothetical protein
VVAITAKSVVTHSSTIYVWDILESHTMQLLSIEWHFITLLFSFMEHMSSNCRIILNDILERMSKEAAMIRSEELLQFCAWRGLRKAPISGLGLWALH